MTIKQKFLGLTLTLIVIAAIGISATSALAQDTGSATATPSPAGTPGYTWNMYGMMRGHRQGDTMWTAVAGALGIDVNTLFTELQSGKTLAQIAEAQNVDVQTVYDAALTVMTDHMNAMVTAGYITQAQADAYQVWMRDNMAQMPMFNDASYGSGMMGGMMGGNYGQGMMGQGMWDHHDEDGRGNWTEPHHGGCGW
ncbi:MAG: hypothetical protein R3E39_00915 [Anaerolineae bacterium]